MTVTPEIQREILADHAKNPQRFSPFRTSKALGVPIQDVMEVVNNNSDASAQLTARFEGLGMPGLRDFAVARRRAMASGWNNSDAPIAAARTAYEAGTHIMITGRDGPWLILYSIPRKRAPQPRPGYFSTESI